MEKKKHTIIKFTPKELIAVVYGEYEFKGMEVEIWI